MDIINFIGSIFKFIWGIVKFGFGIIKKILECFYYLVESIASVFGVKSLGVKFLIAALSSIALSIIPDLVSYYCCRFSKEYRKLEKNEERKEYVSRHTHFLLKVILDIKNKIREKNATKVDDQDEELAFPAINADTIAERIVDNNIEQKNENAQNNEDKSNIKILYSSNIIGKMLRKDTVLERKFLADDRPVLVDFSNVPKEVLTNHSLDKNSGIKFRKNISGSKVEKYLDDPDFLQNPELYTEATLEELKELKEKLEKDQKYQVAIRSFFTINDKALEHTKI